MFDAEFAPTTEDSLGPTEETATPSLSLESGEEDHQKAILSTYDKVGKFDLKKLEVQTLESGLKILDKYQTFTKDRPKLITIGAHTSHGKSALLMQIAAHVAKNELVVVHSFEMTKEEIEARILASITTVPTNMLLPGSVAEKKVDAARRDFENRKLYVSNIPNRSLNFVLSSIVELSKILGKPGLVVIDYAQQVKPGGVGLRENRVNEITDISAGLLQLAQQLKCNVLVGAQLNNEVLRRAYASKDENGDMEYVPIISDIREGSSIAHDSATVLMIVRPYVFNRKADKADATFYCLKNRGGELWDAKVKWDGPRCMFYEKDEFRTKETPTIGL